MNVSQEELTEKSLFDKRVLKNKWTISESEEWVVENPSMEDNIFSHFSLMNFLTYDLNCIPKVTLMNFANALKLKILDKIMEFEPPYREQLQVLCKITDGNQTERNQNIITKRMLTIINKQEINSKHSSKLFNSQNTASQEELTSRYFSSGRNAENINESDVKSSIPASETNKNDKFNDKGVAECDQVKTIESRITENGINASEEEWVVETPVCNKALKKTNDTASASQVELGTKSLTSDKTFHKKDDDYGYKEEWEYETPPYQKPLTKSTYTANEPKEELTTESLSSNGTNQEAIIRDKSLENTDDKHTLSIRNAPNENNFINASDEEWNVTSPVKSNSYSEFGESSKSHYNHSDKQWTTNYHAKEEISKENIDGKTQESFLASGCITSGKNEDPNSKERRTEASNFAGRSMRKFFSEIRNEPGSNRNNGWRPAVKFEEFIPGKMKKLPSERDKCLSHVETSTFNSFSLTDLLKYDMDRMPSDELKNYASALKSRVSDKFFEFEPSYREELEVFCDITDGNQTDRNLKIICSRICVIVNRTILSKPRWDKSYK